MSGNSIRLTRRRLLGGIGTIAAASAAAGGGTMAYLTDSETSSENTIRAGTLGLTIDTSSTAQFLTETEIAPGDSGQETLLVQNDGSIPGYLNIEASNLISYENGLVGNEGSRDNTGGDPGEGNGELQNHLEVNAYLQDGPSLWPSDFEVISDVLSTGTSYNLDYELRPGESETFVLDWELPIDTGREAKSDGIELDLTFSLNQNEGS